MTALRSIPVLLLFLAAGIGLVRLSPGLRRRVWPAQLAWGWLLGAVWCGAALWTLSLATGRPPGLFSLILVAALPVLLAGVSRRARTVRPPLVVLRGRWLAIPAVAGVIVFTAVFAESATNPIHDWDGRMTWGAHARFVAAEGADSPAIRDRAWLVFHPRYPLLLPTLQAVITNGTAIPDDDRVVRPFYALFLAAFVVLLADEASFFGGTRVAAAVATLAVLLPQLAWHPYGPGGTYSDFPLACFWGGGLLLLISFGKRTAPGPAGLLLAGALLTKSEGLLLAVIAFAALAVSGRLRRSVILGATPPFAAGAALLLLWRSGIQDRLSDRFDVSATLSDLPARLGRLPAILRLAAGESLRFDRWGLFWLLAPLLVLLGASALRSPRVRSLGVALAGALLVYGAAYLTTDIPLQRLIGTTWTRFLVQIALPALLIVAASLRASTRGSASPAVRAAGP